MMEVAAGIVQNDAGEILLCQRKGELEGLWEFPGGKREVGESFPECLIRELSEELSLGVTVIREICRMSYEQKGIPILFSFLWGHVMEKEALVLTVHQDARWVKKDEVFLFPLCPADAAFVKAGWLEKIEQE